MAPAGAAALVLAGAASFARAITLDAFEAAAAGSQPEGRLSEGGLAGAQPEGPIALWKQFRGRRLKTARLDTETEPLKQIERLKQEQEKAAAEALAVDGDGVNESELQDWPADIREILDEADKMTSKADMTATTTAVEQMPDMTYSDPESLIVTTGYWRLTNADADQGALRNGPGGYVKRMKIIMSLNVPIITYGDEFGNSNMVYARGNTTNEPLVDTVQVPREQLPPCATHDALIRGNISKYTNVLHMPSISLGCVWDGKFSLVGRTARDHPGYGWYAWLDIGMHGGPDREKLFVDWGSKPWPNPEKLRQLPRDKITASRTFACQTCKEGQYVPFCHCVAATAFMIPAEIVHEVVHFFNSTLEKCLDETAGRDDGYPCMSEQVIMTQMEMQRPGLYNFVGKGYGDLAGKMTMTEMAQLGKSGDALLDWLSVEDGKPSIMLNQAAPDNVE